MSSGLILTSGKAGVFGGINKASGALPPRDTQDIQQWLTAPVDTEATDKRDIVNPQPVPVNIPCVRVNGVDDVIVPEFVEPTGYEGTFFFTVKESEFSDHGGPGPSCPLFTGSSNSDLTDDNIRDRGVYLREYGSGFRLYGRLGYYPHDFNSLTLPFKSDGVYRFALRLKTDEALAEDFVSIFYEGAEILSYADIDPNQSVYKINLALIGKIYIGGNVTGFGKFAISDIAFAPRLCTDEECITYSDDGTIPNGMQIEYHFEEGKADKFYDVSGNGHTATYQGSDLEYVRNAVINEVANITTDGDPNDDGTGSYWGENAEVAEAVEEIEVEMFFEETIDGDSPKVFLIAIHDDDDEFIHTGAFGTDTISLTSWNEEESWWIEDVISAGYHRVNFKWDGSQYQISVDGVAKETFTSSTPPAQIAKHKAVVGHTSGYGFEQTKVSYLRINDTVLLANGDFDASVANSNGIKHDFNPVASSWNMLSGFRTLAEFDGSVGGWDTLIPENSVNKIEFRGSMVKDTGDSGDFYAVYGGKVSLYVSGGYWYSFYESGGTGLDQVYGLPSYDYGTVLMDYSDPDSPSMYWNGELKKTSTITKFHPTDTTLRFTLYDFSQTVKEGVFDFLKLWNGDVLVAHIIPQANGRLYDVVNGREVFPDGGEKLQTTLIPALSEPMSPIARFDGESALVQVDPPVGDSSKGAVFFTITNINFYEDPNTGAKYCPLFAGGTGTDLSDILNRGASLRDMGNGEAELKIRWGSSYPSDILAQHIPITQGVPLNFAISYDVATNDRALIYVNGVKYSDLEQRTKEPYTPFAINLIGKSNISSNGVGYGKFDLLQFAFASRLATDSELQAYSSNRQLPHDVILYLTAKDGSGTTMPDQSGHGNDGDITFGVGGEEAFWGSLSPDPRGELTDVIGGAITNPRGYLHNGANVLLQQHPDATPLLDYSNWVDAYGDLVQRSWQNFKDTENLTGEELNKWKVMPGGQCGLKEHVLYQQGTVASFTERDYNQAKRFAGDGSCATTPIPLFDDDGNILVDDDGNTLYRED